MADDNSVDSSSLMDLGQTATLSGSSSADVIDGKKEIHVRLVQSPAYGDRRKNERDELTDDEEDFRLLEPDRRSHVGSLSSALQVQSNQSLMNSKINWGQDATLSPSKTNLTAAQLAGIILKQKAEETEQSDEMENRLQKIRPLTGSITSRLNTPNIDFERMTDSPSPEKMKKMEVKINLDSHEDVEAVHVEDRAGEVFGIEDAVIGPEVEVGQENELLGDDIGDEMVEMKDDLSVGSQITMGSGGDPRSPERDGAPSPEVGIISDNGVAVDTRPIVEHHGKSGHFTEGVLQQFPLIGDFSSGGGTLGAGENSSSLLQTSKSVDALGSESVGSVSATTFGSGLASNIIKPIRGSSLSTSVTSGVNQGSVNLMLERFVEKEKENREKELILSTKHSNDTYLHGLSLEASSIARGPVTMENSDGGSVSTAGSRRSQRSKGGSHQSPSSFAVGDSAQSGSIEIDFHLPALPVAAGGGGGAVGDVAQLSDRSSLNSASQTTTDEDPLRRITLQPQANVNQLYDASQREALAMFYLNEQGSRTSINDEDSLSSADVADGLIPYRIHNRIMGWKLTSPKKRRQLLGMLDSVQELNKPSTGGGGSYASSKHNIPPPTMRQAQAWGDAVNRMHRARDRTPEGYFKKMMKERAEVAGSAQRGSGRPGSVQTRLIAETDKAGLHRAIRDGLTTMENEIFLDSVREKSRERSRQISRQKSAGAGGSGGGGTGAKSSAQDKKQQPRREKGKPGEAPAAVTGREGLGSRGFVEGPVTSWND